MFELKMFYYSSNNVSVHISQPFIGLCYFIRASDICTSLIKLQGFDRKFHHSCAQKSFPELDIVGTLKFSSIQHSAYQNIINIFFLDD